MKRLLLFSACLLAVSILAAQETDNIIQKEEFSPFTFKRDHYYWHEFGLIHGLFTDLRATDAFQDYKDELCKKHIIEEETIIDFTIESMSVNAYYLYNMDDRMSIGLVAGLSYERSWFNREIPNYADNYVETMPITNAGHASCRLWYGLPIIRYIWFDNRKFCFYSKAGIGICWQRLRYSGDSERGIASSEKCSNEIAYQFTPIGLLMTAGRFRFFVEAGFNTSGIINFGVSCRLGKVNNQ